MKTQISHTIMGSVANGVFGDISMFRNTVNIGLFLFQKPDKWLFATERVPRALSSC